MKKFAELFTAVDQTTKTNAKIAALVNYFSKANERDTIWCIAMLMGKPPKRTIKSGELRTWGAEASGLPLWLFEESYHIVGDLAETISLCLPSPTEESNISLTDTIELLNSLSTKSEEQKKQVLINHWQQLDKAERFVFNKLITGGFRMGVSKQLIIKALAKAYHLEENTVAHRLMGNWTPAKVTLKTLLLTDNQDENYYRPYPFYLAYQLDMPLEDLGNVIEWQIERKFDGIRGQIIIRKGALFVWSRGEELVTDQFPEFEVLKDLLPEGTVLDGEILPFRDGQIQPFHLMQTRISRKNVTKKSLVDAPLVMICYDLLEMNGIDMRHEPLVSRRQKLETLLTVVAQKANRTFPLLLSPTIEVENWHQVTEERQMARENLCEGLMLKHKSSVYETGRRRGNWWKWKVDPLTVDGVLIYAQRGHGRRANLFTDYTFAVWDGPTLVPFTKAYSGLTDKEMIEVDAWIKQHTIDKFGPVRSVTAELVFEIAFEGINRSPRHKSGVALRFPRISRIRYDKKKEEANTKADLLKMIEQQS